MFYILCNIKHVLRACYLCALNLNNSRSDRSLSIEFSNHMQRLTEFVLTISDSRINLIIRLNFTGKSVAIFTEKVIFWLKKVTYFIANYFRQCLIF